MIRYVFKEGPLPLKNGKDADPQAIGEALAAITEAHGGHLKDEDVHEAARDASHPMHKHLEWDDAVAGKAYRLEQIRRIVRLIRIEDSEADYAEPPRAFLSVADKGGVSYRSLKEVVSSAHLQRLVLDQAERDLFAFERRYKEFTDICDIVEQARVKVIDKRDSLPVQAGAAA